MQKHEVAILNRFVQKGILKGKFLTELPLGFTSTSVVLDAYREASSRDTIYQWHIDVVCIEDEETEILHLRGNDLFRYIDRYEGRYAWIFEVERKLNPTALGQIIIYRELFVDDYTSGGKHSNYALQLKKTGIICEETSKRLEMVANKYDVHIFTT